MASISKKPLTQLVEEPPASFPITVEAVIGHVDMGGRDHPFVAAMGVVARYHKELRENGDAAGDHVYRFQGWDEDETVVVNITAEQPNHS